MKTNVQHHQHRTSTSYSECRQGLCHSGVQRHPVFAVEHSEYHLESEHRYLADLWENTKSIHTSSRGIIRFSEAAYIVEEAGDKYMTPRIIEVQTRLTMAPPHRAAICDTEVAA